MNDIAPFYSVKSLACRLACSERNVWRLISAGKISAVRFGRTVRIPGESVADFEAAMPRVAPARTEPQHVA